MNITGISRDSFTHQSIPCNRQRAVCHYDDLNVQFYRLPYVLVVDSTYETTGGCDCSVVLFSTVFKWFATGCLHGEAGSSVLAIFPATFTRTIQVAHSAHTVHFVTYMRSHGLMGYNWIHDRYIATRSSNLSRFSSSCEKSLCPLLGWIHAILRTRKTYMWHPFAILKVE